MTTPKRKRGRPPIGTTPSQGRSLTLHPRCSPAEVELLERAAEQLRRQTGRQHTASSVLRDGGLAFAGIVMERAKGDG